MSKSIKSSGKKPGLFRYLFTTFIQVIKAFAFLALILAIMLFIAEFFLVSNPKSLSNEAENERLTLIAEAHNQIKLRLSSPRSAEFPSLLDGHIVLHSEGDVATVTSWVYAQNGFGAESKYPWSVEFKKNGDQWIVDNVIIKEWE